MNAALGSSDLLFDMELVSTVRESIPPRVLGASPLPGNVFQLTNITVTFSEPVTGFDSADVDLSMSTAVIESVLP